MGYQDPIKKLFAGTVNSELRTEDRERLEAIEAAHVRAVKVMKKAMSYGVVASSGMTANGIFLGFASAGLTGFADKLIAGVASAVAAVLIGVGTMQLMRLAGGDDV